MMEKPRQDLMNRAHCFTLSLSLSFSVSNTHTYSNADIYSKYTI